MTVRNVKKNLAGQQDLLPGLGPYEQIRRGQTVTVDGPAKSYFDLFVRSYAEAGLPVKGTFEDGCTLATVYDIAIYLADGKGYSYSGTLPHTIGAGETPIGNPNWVSVAAKSPEYRPEMFGAIGDGVADDSDALDACFAAGTRICLYKNYRRTRPLAIVGGKQITAATPWVGRIYFDNCDAGTHTLVNRNDQAIWDGVSLLSISKGTKIGLIATGNGLTNRLRSFIFRNCNFSGADLLQQATTWPGETTANIQEWKVDLRILNASFSLVDGCAFTGKASARNYAWDTETTGLIVQSSTYVSILNSKILFRKYGYALVGSTEGFSDINNQIVDCYDGGTNQQHGGTIDPANNWVVKGGHCDCSHRGLIFGANSDDSIGGLHSIEGRLFLKRESGGVSGYKAIDLNTARSSVAGNIIQTNGATLDYVGMGDAGIRIAGVENSVTGNIGRNTGTLLELTSTSQHNIVTGNRLSKAGTATSKLYSDDGTQNVVAANSFNSGPGAHRAVTPTNQLLGGGSAYSIDVQSSGLAPNYDTRLEFIGGSAVDAGGSLILRVAKLNTTAADTNVNIIRPNATNTSSCGTAAFAWSGIFTQTAPTITSDERSKTAPLSITDAMLDAAEEVDWVQYQYLDRVEAKGVDGARWHFGAVAQRFVEAFARHGLDAHEFGFICYDEWEASDEEVNEETGEVVSTHVDAGSLYGIRYEEALALEAALQRRNYQRLLTRIEALEAK